MLICVRTYVCQQCGASFVRRSQGRPAKFCSITCSAASRKAVLTGTCQLCGAVFERTKGNYHSPPKFCSRRCNVTFNARNNPQVVRTAAAAAADKKRGKIKHGIGRYNRLGCRCEICKSAAKHFNATVRHAIPVASAHRWGYQWTGPELEIASRSDLTAIQVAQMLGRTVSAVQNKRQQLRIDPRMINLAGAPRVRR